jgi:hypothetical protein
MEGGRDAAAFFCATSWPGGAAIHAQVVSDFGSGLVWKNVKKRAIFARFRAKTRRFQLDFRPFLALQPSGCALEGAKLATWSHRKTP